MADDLNGQVFSGNDAAQLLANPLLKTAFDKLGAYLEGQALSCAPEDKDKAQRVIISKQLLAGIKRELERIVENGKLAKIKLSELEKKRGMRAIFQR